MLTEIDDILPADQKLNLEVFSMGAYSNPTQSGDYMRSVIPEGRFYPRLFSIAMQCDKDNIHDELLEWCDVVWFMHNSAIPGQKEQQPWVARNLAKIQKYKKKAIWRSIGQSTPAIEKELTEYRGKGLQIIRYSPLEEKLPDYAGANAFIRFAKDKYEFTGWNGQRQHVITIAQSFKKRGEHLGYHLFEKVTYSLNRKVYGTENADLGEANGGSPSYEELKATLRDTRCMFYYGTQPAPYTLSLIEAMMTGVPIVAVGKKLRNTIYPWDSYEVPDFISNGVNGFISDDIKELRGYIELLLNDHDTAKRIGQAGRETAIKLFEKRMIMNQWAKFLKTI
jgi:glycosyltransferase involved in cell wall biosynthesis